MYKQYSLDILCYIQNTVRMVINKVIMVINEVRMANTCKQAALTRTILLVNGGTVWVLRKVTHWNEKSSKFLWNRNA